MIELRPFASLGHADHGWLDAHHHFSFSDYLDRHRMLWGRLRVWNDDVIAPGTGFAPHPHNDMEIITYVRQGAISHEDSLSNKGRTEAGDVQVMSAGTGIVHSEWNHESVPTTLFQIWIFPDRKGEGPSWGTRRFPRGDRAGKLIPLASGMEGDSEALPIRANARVSGATLAAGDEITYQLAPGRHVYLVSATGKLRIGDITAQARDGVAIADVIEIKISALEDSELILVDTAS